MVMQDEHKDLSWFGQEKALRLARRESLYYLAPKCLYRGEYKSGECGFRLRMKLGWRDVVYASVLFYLPCLRLGVPFYKSRGGIRL